MNNQTNNCIRILSLNLYQFFILFNMVELFLAFLLKDKINMWIFIAIDFAWLIFIISNDTKKTAQSSKYIKENYPKIFSKYLTGSMYREIELLDFSVIKEIPYFRDKDKKIYNLLKCRKQLRILGILSVFMLLIKTWLWSKILN